MREHRLEVADVFHAHRDEFLHRWGHTVSDQQRKVLRDIGRCRMAALGTHLERCDRCGYETVAYDSCRNRHCPKCQSSLATAGSSSRLEVCSPCPTRMSSSPCLNSWRHSRSATSVSFMAFHEKAGRCQPVFV